MKQYVPIRSYPWIATALVSAGWELGCRLFSVPSWILPAPSAILGALLESFPLMVPHVGFTVITALSGLMGAVAVAVAAALLMDLFPTVKATVYPFLVVSQTVPIIFVYPLLMIWFGFGIAAKIIVVVLVCFFPAAVALSDGMSAADPELVDLFRSMGAGRWRILTMVKVPGALVSAFSGLKIAATYCVMGAVIGEWLGARYGMGVFMMRAYKTFDTPRVFAAIIVVVVLSFAFYRATVLAEGRAMPWRKTYGKERVS